MNGACTPQAAVIPYRIRKEARRSGSGHDIRGTGWIVPKGLGQVDEGQLARDAAIREAEEESRTCWALSRGSRSGAIAISTATALCRVEVYLMRVTSVLDHWLERTGSGGAAGCASRMPQPACGKSCGSSSTPSRARRTGILRPCRNMDRRVSRHATESASSSFRERDASAERDHEEPAGAPAARHRQQSIAAEQTFTVLDTFDTGRVRRARSAPDARRRNGDSTVAWQPQARSEASSRSRLKQPVDSPGIFPKVRFSRRWRR